MTNEIELNTLLFGEIVNSKSNDHLQTFYFTHKCTDSANVTWYKAHTDYPVENTTALWFKETEIDWSEIDWSEWFE